MEERVVEHETQPHIRFWVGVFFQSKQTSRLGVEILGILLATIPELVELYLDRCAACVNQQDTGHNLSYNPISSVGRDTILVLPTLQRCILKLDCDVLDNQLMSLVPVGVYSSPRGRWCYRGGVKKRLASSDGSPIWDRRFALLLHPKRATHPAH